MQNWIVWTRNAFRYKNGFGVKQPTMVDMPSNQTKLVRWLSMQNDFFILFTVNIRCSRKVNK